MEWYAAPVSTAHHMKWLTETGAVSPHKSQLLSHWNRISNSYNTTPDDITAVNITALISHSFIHSFSQQWSLTHFMDSSFVQIDMFLIIQTCMLQIWIQTIIFHFTNFSKLLFQVLRKWVLNQRLFTKYCYTVCRKLDTYTLKLAQKTFPTYQLP